MRLQYQLLDDDCYRTTLACILNRTPEQVPHFYEEAYSDLSEDKWKVNESIERWIDQWLKLNGHARIRNVLVDSGAGLKGALLTSKVFSPVNYPAILSGQNKAGRSHCVIVQNGEVLWNVGGPNSLLTQPLANGCWVLEWIIRPVMNGA